MGNNRDLDREGLEVYLVNLLMAVRPYIQIGGSLLLIYALVVITKVPIIGSFSLGLAIFALLLTYSFTLTLYLAKLIAWITSISKRLKSLFVSKV